MLIPPHVIKSASRCVDTETSRHALGGVMIERQPDGRALAVSCDGRRLTTLQWSEPKPDEYPAVNGYSKAQRPDFKAIVPVKPLLEGAKMVPKRVHKPILNHVLLTEDGPREVLPENSKDTPRAEEVVLAATDLQNPKSQHVRCLEGRYPRWREVVPEYTLPTGQQVDDMQATGVTAVEICVDAKLLAGLLASADDANTGASRTKVVLEVPLDSCRAIKASWQGNGVEWSGVIMPVTKD